MPPVSTRVSEGRVLVKNGLAQQKELGIFHHNVEEHGELLRRIFALLTEA
jgi:hypothetical protein